MILEPNPLASLPQYTDDELADTARLADYLQLLALRWKFGDP